MNAWIRDQLPRIRDVRDKAGWRPTTLDSGSFCARCMCVMAELRELEVAVAVGRREDVELECADVAIYLIIILNDLHPPSLTDVVRFGAIVAEHNDSSIRRYFVDRVRTSVINAWEAWRRDRHEDIYHNLRVALESVIEMSKAFSVNLADAVAKKTEINASRGQRHGLKHPDT